MYIRINPLYFPSRAFDGFPVGEDFVDQAQELAEDIGDMSLIFEEFYYNVEYDGCTNPFNRRNEVAFVGRPAAAKHGKH